MDIDTWNPQYGLYHFDLESDDVALAETCLTYLSFEEFAVGELYVKTRCIRDGKHLPFVNMRSNFG